MATGAKDRLKEILDRREYQIYYEDTRSLFQRIKDWFQELIAELLEKLFPALGSTTNIAGIIVTIIIIVAVILLGVVLYRVAQNVKMKRRYQTSPIIDLHEMDWTYEKHFEMAKQKEEQGEHEQAVRHLFLALLLYFHEINWVEAKIWKTNWEYYAELKKVNKQGAESFNELALLFDQVTYGKRDINLDQYEKFRETVMTSFERTKAQVEREKEE